jgi:hypothetical protein
MVPITEEERNSPLYKYYIRKMTEPAPSRYDEVQEPIDPMSALPVQEMNRLFDDGYLPGEIGYCRFPDGTATLANLTQFPGTTPEMFDWWFAWHGVAPMRYKIWNPDEHYYCQTLNLDKALNESLLMKERYWDTTHDIEEDVGRGKQKIMINFRNPADIGFDPEKLKKFNGTIVCSGNERAPTIMVHFMRPTKEGSELRTRFWMGYNVINGKPSRMFPKDGQFPLEPVKALLLHNIKEFTNLAAILPEVYAEFRDKF